jgi:hypothetical protein
MNVHESFKYHKRIMIFKGLMNIHEHNFPISEMGFVVLFAQGITSLQNTLFPPL